MLCRALLGWSELCQVILHVRASSCTGLKWYKCRQHSETLHKFLAATAKGYEYAAQHPEEAAELLCQTATDTAFDKDMVKESMQLLSQVRMQATVCHQQI